MPHTRGSTLSTLSVTPTSWIAALKKQNVFKNNARGVARAANYKLNIYITYSSYFLDTIYCIERIYTGLTRPYEINTWRESHAASSYLDLDESTAPIVIP
jgi:hypothetical protein